MSSPGAHPNNDAQTSPRYSATSRRLHWLMAVLVVLAYIPVSYTHLTLLTKRIV